MKIDRPAFNSGVIDVLTLAPLRSWIMGLFKKLRARA